ncbi:hypothetical protein V8E55_009486 [Tylopilus felleus]
MIDFLIEYGVNVHTHTAAGDPMLHFALQSSVDEETALKIVKFLVERGCNPLETNTSAETPLHITVR